MHLTRRFLLVLVFIGALASCATPTATSLPPRDQIAFDGNSPPGIPPGMAGVASSQLARSGAGRTVVGDYKSGVIAERVVGHSWPVVDNHLATPELHH